MFDVEYWSPKKLDLIPERYIERNAKVAYRSEAKITEDSYKEFLPRVVIKNRDHSVCEHYGDVIEGMGISDIEMLELLEINPFIPYRKIEGGYRLLINGRNVLEFLSSKSTNAIYHILSSVKDIYPVFLSDFKSSTFRYFTTPAHEYKDDPRFILATYFIKGVSRVTETQWVRHRRFSFTVMSGRGVDFRDQKMVYPPTFMVRAFDPFMPDWNVAEAEVDECVYRYTGMRDTYKIPRQDARYILPQGLSTEMVVSGTLQWFNYFHGLRSVKPAQWEIKGFSRVIQTDLNTRYPMYVSAPPEEINDGHK